MQDYSFLLNILAGALLVTGQSVYIFQVWKKQIKPSLFTWLGWSVLVGVALFSQVMEWGWNWTLTGHIMSAVGCTVIFISTLLSRHFVVLPKDAYYLTLGVLCILLYVLSSNPWFTTIFAILADAILGLPTIVKAIKFPLSEKSKGWNIALLCWTLTLISCIGKDPIYLIFPAYCFLFNGSMIFLTRKQRVNLMRNGIHTLG